MGTEQHGHIEAMLRPYVKFLREAISKLKGEKVEERFETTIDISVDGYILRNI